MNSDPEDHRRRSIRLKGYDYSAAGGYYVTVVAFHRECLFVEIVGGEMRLNALGRIVREEWFKTAALRSYVELREDEFVVMPNHIHGIFWIFDDIVGAQEFVGAQRRCAPTPNVKPRSLGAIVRALKSAVTYRANRELNSANIWQRNYYEHIIRDQPDYERIAGYILANPSNWNDDEENPYL
jgi:REP element-mobilizing transposase RayT